jgi:excisionase family DNA binding protein
MILSDIGHRSSRLDQPLRGVDGARGPEKGEPPCPGSSVPSERARCRRAGRGQSLSPHVPVGLRLREPGPPAGDTPGTVRIVHGANEQILAIAGRTVGWVRANLRDALNLGYFAEPFVNYRAASQRDVLRVGDQLEFLCRFGLKGSGEEPAESRRARALIGVYPELARIGNEVRAMALDADSAVEMTLSLVVQFLERTFGPLPVSEAPTLGVVVEMLARIEGRIEALSRAEGRPPDGSPLSIKQAAKAVNLSETHLRRAIARGELAASDVGSEGRRLWRILPTDLSRWLERKKGGDQKVPPRSELKDLIRRHLPGL